MHKRMDFIRLHMFPTLCAWWQAKYLALGAYKIMAIVNAAQTNRLVNNDLLH